MMTVLWRLSKGALIISCEYRNRADGKYDLRVVTGEALTTVETASLEEIIKTANRMKTAFMADGFCEAPS